MPGPDPYASQRAVRAGHPKHVLPETVQPGQNLVVSYSNGLAQLKPNQIRERVLAVSR
jgi:hypothetical protein